MWLVDVAHRRSHSLRIPLERTGHLEFENSLATLTILNRTRIQFGVDSEKALNRGGVNKACRVGFSVWVVHIRLGP